MNVDEATADIVIMRAARQGDLEGLYELARLGGTGLTNLPPDRPTLADKLAAHQTAIDNADARALGAPLLLIAEHADGAILGTSCIFPRIGVDWPFYSYRITRQVSDSRTAQRRAAQRLLVLANDFDGESEVGGLFIHPEARHLKIGKLAARSRYLFMAQHRDWFGRIAISELRGWQDAQGRSPLWEAVGRHFYDMSLAEADRFGAIHGNQFIADLGPRHPLYVSMLPAEAQAALGRPHDDGRAAHAMLLAEGFRDHGYVDIFDGGPTPVAMIDELEAIRTSRAATASDVKRGEPIKALIAAGTGAAFRVTCAAALISDDLIWIDPSFRRRLDLQAGDPVRWCPA